MLSECANHPGRPAIHKVFSWPLCSECESAHNFGMQVLRTGGREMRRFGVPHLRTRIAPAGCTDKESSPEDRPPASPDLSRTREFG